MLRCACSRSGASVERIASDAQDIAQAGDDLDLRAALRTRSFWILTATLFSFFFYFTGVLDAFVLFLVDAGLSKDNIVRVVSMET